MQHARQYSSNNWIDFESLTNMASPFRGNHGKRQAYMLENNENVEIQINGCLKEDLIMQMDNGCLHVSNRKRQGRPNTLDPSFNDATFALPKSCNVDSADCLTRDDGVLLIRIPKSL